MEGRPHRISKAAVVGVLDIDDRMLLGQEDWELPELEARQRYVFHHLDVGLHDLLQDQAREISVESDMSLTNGLDQRVKLFVQQHGTCDDALPAVEDDRVHVAEILCGVGLAHIDRHPEVDAVFVVDHVEEGGCQLRTKMFELDFQIREVIVTDERHLLDVAVDSISIPTASTGETSFFEPPPI